MRDDLGLQCTHRWMMQLFRALQIYADRKQDGANARAALRGMRKRFIIVPVSGHWTPGKRVVVASVSLL